jgi:tetratricopeptide (TPR) repeat protein
MRSELEFDEGSLSTAGIVAECDVPREFKKLRENNIRDSEVVVRLAQPIIFTKAHIFGDDIYNVYEQVLVAALDLGKFELVDSCMDILDSRFPDSMRVQKLKGMRLEAACQFDDAITHYNSLLELDPTNATCRKRLVVIKRCIGDVTGAKKELCDHVQNFQADHEAWHELADLYIEDGEFNKALFCLEELIVANAYNHLYYVKYAEVRYSLGGLENIEMARKYFAMAVKLSDFKNTRALVGMVMSAHYLAINPKSSSKQKKDNVKYAVWAYENLEQKYLKCKEKNPRLPPGIQGLGALVESLNISL